MTKSAKVPDPPSLTPQELDLINQQKLSLEQFSNILGEESIQRKETQDILKKLSGLFNEEITPESRGEDTTRQIADTALVQQIGADTFKNDFVNRINELKQQGPVSNKQIEDEFRKLVPKEFADDVISSASTKKGSFEQALGDVAQRKVSVFGFDPIKSGFVKDETVPGELIPESKKLILNEEAVSDLRNRIQENIAFQESQVAKDREIESRATDILGQFADELESSISGPTVDIQKEIAQKTAERNLLALEGKLPIDPAIIEEESKSFQALKENVARRGGEIIGDDPSTATGVGTVGQRAIEDFKKRFDLLKDSSRRGELDSGSVRNISQSGFVSDLLNRGLGNTLTLRGATGGSSVPSLTSLNFLTNAQDQGPASLLGAFPSLTNSLSAAQAPFANQRNLQFQASAENAALSSQRQAGLINLGGSLASTALLLKLLPSLSLSSKKAKKNIKLVSKRQENKVLNLVRKGNVYTWDYKWEKDGKKPKHIGIIAEEAPEPMTALNRNAQDLGNTVNILLTSVKALDRKVSRLTRRVA